jgi:uncharacterized membrane protein
MSEPTGRPPALDERLLAVAVELTRLGRRVDELGGTVNALVAELRGEAAAGVPGGVAEGALAGPREAPRPSADASRPPVPPRVSRPYTTDPVATLWTPPSGVSAAPAGGPWGPPPPGFGPPAHQGFQYAAPIGPRPPTPVERLRGRLSGPALLAVTGAAVTLLGVVLLLVLAATRGWFSPPGRVAAGAMLGAALVGLALRLHRRPEARTGALALAATGITALYLTVAAATALHALLPEVGGLVAALAVAAGGVVLADRWRSRALAVGTVVGGALLAPFVADGPGPLLVALVVVLQAAALPAVVRRGWGVLAATAATAPALYGLVGPFDPAGEPLGPAVATAAAALVVGLAPAVLPERPGRRPAPVAAAWVVAAAPLPLLALAARTDRWPGAGLALLAAVALLALAIPTGRAAVRLTALAAGSVAVLEATVVAFDGATLDAVLLGEGLVLLAAAALLRSRPALLAGGGFAAVGYLGALAGGLPDPTAVPPSPVPFRGLVLAVLVLAAAVAALVAAGRSRLVRADARTAVLWVPLALVALHGATATVVTAALLVSPDRAGFLAGHALVTVSWTVAALVLLARGIARPALRAAGAVLVAAAVGKLVLFDLLALDGLARVVAFLGAGLVLLAAGHRYARLVARGADGGRTGGEERGQE